MAWLCSSSKAWQISFANAGLALPANTLRRSWSCFILSTGFEAAIVLASCALTVPAATDRKSTRLNSSHLGISYAVFCLENTSELQSLRHLVCRLLLGKHVLTLLPLS